MDLPQPRAYGGSQGRKPTHDFLSLYDHSTVQQDPRPTSQVGYPKTHDFLQPLERRGKTSAKVETTVETSTAEKPPPPSGEHILPGGIGTYSISHISYFNQRAPKPEGSSLFTVAQASSTERNDENSNCSSYSGSGFTLWEESAEKGKTGKEKAGERNIVRESAAKTGQWSCSERPSQSSSNNNHHGSSFSSLSSSLLSGQQSQTFMEMLQSTKGCRTREEDMNDEEEFQLKKESSVIQKGELMVQVDGKSTDQKPNTPRSKHSATEQRRRSKINDRFQTLRELIPHSDQKRDKASLLLEVIDYIQFLHEKVHKYEGSYQGWNHEAAKVMPSRNNHRTAENYVDQSRGIGSWSDPTLGFDAKFDEKNIIVSPAITGNAQNHVDSELITTTNFKGMNHYTGITNKAVLFPASLQSNIFAPSRSGGTVSQLPTVPISDAENAASKPQPQLSYTRSCTAEGGVAGDKVKEEELTIEGGTVSISSVYSQELLNTLKQALQSSGVDLSQASISVQIELGKQANFRPTAPTSIFKDNEFPSSYQGTTRSRVASGNQASDQAPKKKLKTGRS